MPDRPFRSGPLVVVTGLLGLSLYGWLYSPGTVDGTPPRPPASPIATAPPLPPEPPAAVRPVTLAPAMVPTFERQTLTVARDGSLRASGTVDPGAQVSLLANGVAIAETTAGPDGAWALGPTAPLAAGTTEFRLRSQLADGRTATSAETVTVVMPRTTAEAFIVSVGTAGQPRTELARIDPVPVVRPTFGDATVTEDGTLTVRMTVDPGARVELLTGDRVLAQATADGAGAVSIGPVSAPPPGQTRLELRATHPDGRAASSPDRLILTVPALSDGQLTAVREAPDTAPVTLMQRAAAAMAVPRFDTVEARPDGMVTATGRAHPGARVQLRSGDATLAEVVAGDDGRFSIQTTTPLGTGRHALSFATALSDGRSAGSTERLVVDRPSDPRGTFTATLEGDGAPRVLARVEPPPVAPPMPRFEEVSVAPDGTAVLSGRTEPGAHIVLRAGDTVLGEAIAGPDGTWSMIPRVFPAGATEATLTATSPDGRATSTSEERLAVVFPGIAGESYGVVIDTPGGPPRLLARGIAIARPGVEVFVPAPVPPPAPPAPAVAPPPPAAAAPAALPLSPPVTPPAAVARSPETAPVVRANVPPPPRRALPDRLIK